jgi:hypothetical protein
MKMLEGWGIGILESQASAVALLPWLEEVRRNAELMSEARVITGKSEAEIQSAAACSPLSFADFVRLLKTGHKI